VNGQKVADMPETSIDDSAEAIRAWLIERVAFYAERRPDEIATDTALVELGLDSVYALTLGGDIEDRFGVETEATLGWDHPTIDAITEYLVTELN
jgi:acyl carrier protein